MLYEEAPRSNLPVSLATVYNTLHYLTKIGLLRSVAVDGAKTISTLTHPIITSLNALLVIPGTNISNFMAVPDVMRSVKSML